MRRAILAATMLLLGGAPAIAAFQPSFQLEQCSKDATDIVLATEGDKIDGELEVLETWRGGLARGEKILIPALAAFEEPATRAIHGDFGPTEDARRHVTGARMVLFLKRAGTRWVAASNWGDMMVSVVWVERDTVYAFQQIVNPGDSVLVSLATSEKDFHGKVDKVIAAWAEIARARALQDPVARAHALLPFTRAESSDQMESAFDGLATCREAALPTLRAILADESATSGPQCYAMKALVKVLGEGAGPELTRIVEKGLAYWKTTGPELKSGWWGNPAADSATRSYVVVNHALESLTSLRCAACETAVTELRDFWLSLPQLAEYKGLTDRCDGLLRALKKPKPEPEPPTPEEPAPPTVAPAPDPPLSTDEDARKVTQREAKLALDLAAEAARPRETRRTVLGCAPSGGELHTELARALEAALPIGDGEEAFIALVGSWTVDDAPPLLGDVNEATRRRLWPNLTAVESVLAAERVVRPFEVSEGWRSMQVRQTSFNDARVDALSAAHVLQSLHALESGEPAHAADVAIDLWQFEHDLRRDDRLMNERRVGYLAPQLLALALPRCDAKTLDVIDKALAVLEAEAPSFAAEVKRRSLAVGCYFRAYRKGELKTFRSDSTSGQSDADPTPLGHLSPRARLSDRRVGAIRREWEKLDAILDAFATAAERFEWPKGHDVTDPEPWAWDARPKTTPECWAIFLSEEIHRFLVDVGRVRLLRVLVAAQRFRAAKMRWPKDELEAVGEERARKLVDPFTGKPFPLLVNADGVLRVALDERAGKTPESRSFALRPAK